MHGSNIIESETSESNLLTLGKWAVLSVQIPGYFPLQIETNSRGRKPYSKYLSFKLSSPNAIFTILLLTGLTSWNVLFFAQQQSFSKYLKARGPTELYAYTLMLAISSLLGIYITIFGIKNSRKFLHFWRETCELLDRLKKVSSSNSNYVDEEWFQQIEKSMRNGFFSLIIPVSLHILIDYGYRITESIVDDDGTYEDTEFAVGLGVWTFFALSGSGISIWMTFFIKIYSACFQSVIEALEKFGSSSGQKTSDGKKGMNLELLQEVTDNRRGGELYINELFSRVILDPRKNGNNNFSNNYEDVRQVEIEVGENLKMFQSIVRKIDHFNDFFGVLLIFEISVCVVNLLVYLFFALIWLGRSEFGLLLETVVPIYIYGKELYEMGTVSEELTQTAESVIRTFVQVPLESLSPKIHLQLQMLVTQTSTNPPSVSAKQFFIINRSLVTSVLSGLATFLVVLVQFRDADSQTPS